MKIESTATQERDISMHGTVDELALLAMACLSERRTAAQKEALTVFADLLIESDLEIDNAVKEIKRENAQRAAARAENKASA